MTERGVVHRSAPRPPLEAVRALATYGVATIHEALGREGLMAPRIRPIYRGARLCGPALTVLLPAGDNWMLHVAAEVIRDGDVVVATSPEGPEYGYLGELLATSFREQGAVGLVIDGGVRDVHDLETMEFPTFSRSITAQGTVKEQLGFVNLPISCAGLTVAPGDVVVADDDGVVVVPRDRAEEVAAAAAAREVKEAETRRRLAAGEFGLDLYDMRPGLDRAGLRYVD